MRRPIRVLFLGLILILGALGAPVRARAELPLVSIHDASVVEGDSGSVLRFNVVAQGHPRRLALEYSVSDLTASAADGDYAAPGGVVSLKPAPPRLIEHWGAGTLGIPYGVTIAPNGDIITLDTPGGRVVRFAPDGTLLSSFPVAHHPNGVAVSSSGDIFITNYWDFVRKYDASGTLLQEWGGPGTAPGKFDYARNVKIDAADVLYVTDVFNNRVQKFNTNGNLLGIVNAAAPGEPEGGVAIGIAVDPQGHLYVAKGNNRILKFAPDGSLAATWTDTKGICNGWDLHVDDAGNLLIADSHTSRVVVLDDQGQFLTEWTIDEGLNHGGNQFSATAIVSDGSGNVFVASRNSSSIARFRWDAAKGSVEVPILGDVRFEPDETLQVELVATPDATIIDGTAIGTLVNDDMDLGANQIANGQFESGLDGWAAYDGALLDLSSEGIGGSNATYLVGPATDTFGINDSPNFVSSTPAGARYLYSAWVRSDAEGTARLRVREYWAGELQATFKSTPLAFDGTWQRLEVPVRAVAAGSSLDFQVIGEFENTGEAFWIDDIAVQTLGVDVPPVITVDADATGSWSEDIVVPVLVHDPEGEPIDVLEADLSELAGATFTVESDQRHGTLRWRPNFTSVRDEPYLVTLTARNAASTMATTRIRVSPNLVLNPSFETDTGGWNGHLGATVERVSGGRRDGYAARLTLPAVEWSGITDSPNWTSQAGYHRTFVVGAWVRAETNRSRVRLQVREYQDGVLLGSSTIERSPFNSLEGLGPDWRRLVLSYTCLASTASELDVTIDAQGGDGATFDIDDVSIVYAGGSSTVDVPVVLPSTFGVRISPNPTWGPAMLEFSVPAPGPLRVELYDVAGRRRAVIADETRTEPGIRRFGLNGSRGSLDPGVYWCRVSCASGVRVGRLVVLE